MPRITTEIRSEKCVVRRFRRCANVIECTYTNLDIMAYYTPSLRIARLLLLSYKPVQQVNVLHTVGNCNTMVSIIILYYTILHYYIILYYIILYYIILYYIILYYTASVV